MSKTAQGELQNKKGWCWVPPILRAIPSSLLLSFVIAGMSVLILIQGQLSPDVIPFGDGRNFAQKAIELHGQLWSGQFAMLWESLQTRIMVPKLPVGLVFWLLPSSMSTGAVYGVVNCILWNLLMALGVWGILRDLGNPRLAPAVTLLTLANNYALDPSYYYYMDIPFGACSLVVVWLRLRSFMVPSKSRLITAGAIGALLLFVKAGSAFPFLILDSFSFALFSMWRFFSEREGARLGVFRSAVREIGWWGLGFIPIAVIALEGTAARRIVQQLLQNQKGSFWGVVMTETGMLRALYFPLCLTFYYSLLFVVCMLGGLVAVRLAGMRWPRLLAEPQALGRMHRGAFGAILIAYLFVWGGTFSFLMSSRLIRSLPLMLPIAWIALFLIPWIRRVRPSVVFACVVLYVAIAYGQYSEGWFEKRNRWAEEYRLDGDWWNRLPAKRQDMARGVQTTKYIYRQLIDAGVASGKIAVGTQMLYWDASSLNWLAQLPYQRRGVEPPLEFVTAVDHRLAANRMRLTGSKGLVLLVHPGIAEGRAVWECNVRAAKFFMESGQGKALVRSVRTLKLGDGKVAAVVVVLREELSGESLDAFIGATYGGREVTAVTHGGGFFVERHGIVDSVRYLFTMWGREESE